MSSPSLTLFQVQRVSPREARVHAMKNCLSIIAAIGFLIERELAGQSRERLARLRAATTRVCDLLDQDLRSELSVTGESPSSEPTGAACVAALVEAVATRLTDRAEKDGAEGVARFEELRPDVTLMDLQMPVLDGVAAITRIRAIDPKARIIVLTMLDTGTDIDRAMRAGARGYLLKDASAHELAAAVRDVHAGITRIAPAVASRLAERLTQVNLTPRELMVLRLVAEGKANKAIADELTITEGTVKVHLTNLFEKLEVTTRTEAIAAAAKRGLVRMR